MLQRVDKELRGLLDELIVKFYSTPLVLCELLCPDS